MKRRKQRPPRPRSWWEQVVAGYETSGLSEERFCRKHSIGVSTFRWRRARLHAETRRKATSRGDSGGRGLFLPVHVRDAPLDVPAADFEVVLPGERRILVPARFDAKALATLVSTLESVGCS